MIRKFLALFLISTILSSMTFEDSFASSSAFASRFSARFGQGFNPGFISSIESAINCESCDLGTARGLLPGALSHCKNECKRVCVKNLITQKENPILAVKIGSQHAASYLKYGKSFCTTLRVDNYDNKPVPVEVICTNCFDGTATGRNKVLLDQDIDINALESGRETSIQATGDRTATYISSTTKNLLRPAYKEMDIIIEHKGSYALEVRFDKGKKVWTQTGQRKYRMTIPSNASRTPVLLAIAWADDHFKNMPKDGRGHYYVDATKGNLVHIITHGAVGNASVEIFYPQYVGNLIEDKFNVELTDAAVTPVGGDNNFDGTCTIPNIEHAHWYKLNNKLNTYNLSNDRHSVNLKFKPWIVGLAKPYDTLRFACCAVETDDNDEKHYYIGKTSDPMAKKGGCFYSRGTAGEEEKGTNKYYVLSFGRRSSDPTNIDLNDFKIDWRMTEGSAAEFNGCAAIRPKGKVLCKVVDSNGTAFTGFVAGDKCHYARSGRTVTADWGAYSLACVLGRHSIDKLKVSRNISDSIAVGDGEHIANIRYDCAKCTMRGSNRSPSGADRQAVMESCGCKSFAINIVDPNLRIRSNISSAGAERIVNSTRGGYFGVLVPTAADGSAMVRVKLENVTTSTAKTVIDTNIDLREGSVAFRLPVRPGSPASYLAHTDRYDCSKCKVLGSSRGSSPSNVDKNNMMNVCGCKKLAVTINPIPGVQTVRVNTRSRGDENLHNYNYNITNGHSFTALVPRDARGKAMNHLKVEAMEGANQYRTLIDEHVDLAEEAEGNTYTVTIPENG